MSKVIVLAHYQVESCWELDFDPRFSEAWGIEWDTLTVKTPNGEEVFTPTYSAEGDSDMWKRPSYVTFPLDEE